MAQIFISHSRRDKEIINFFASAFATSHVKAIYEEIEKLVTGQNINAAKIDSDIKASNAVFVVIGENVERLSNTRSWVNWESGVACGAAKNKDVWVFEYLHHVNNRTVITPALTHYVVFDIDDPYLIYLKSIIESYDDSHMPTALVAGGGAGALLASTPQGALLGAIAGLFLSDPSRNRPKGIKTSCANCSESYTIHLPNFMDLFKCPCCNTVLITPYQTQ
jgi:hypothetical protein